MINFGRRSKAFSWILELFGQIIHDPGSIHNKSKFHFVIFIFVGGFNTLFSLVVYWALVYFGIHFALATFISNLLGIIFNFFTTGTLVFRNRKFILIFRFAMTYIMTNVLSIAGLKFLLSNNMNKYLAPALLALPMALISYKLMKSFVFKENHKRSLSELSNQG